jgi:hypothetical protein
MGDIIDIRGRLKSQNSSRKELSSNATDKINMKAAREKGEILDMTQRRQEILKAERRRVKRTILREFIGAFAVIPQKGLLKVAMHDISETGLAFDLPEDCGHFNKNEEISVRIYLNKTTYFNFVTRITNVRFIDGEGIIRHGARFVKGTVNDVALHHFVKFIEHISASLKRDSGDVMVSNLNK